MMNPLVILEIRSMSVPHRYQRYLSLEARRFLVYKAGQRLVARRHRRMIVQTHRGHKACRVVDQADLNRRLGTKSCIFRWCGTCWLLFDGK